MTDREPVVIDTNGQKYLAEWDEHGWFSITTVELYPAEAAINANGADTVEYDGTEYCYDTVGEYPKACFDAAGVGKIAELIQEGL